jgi:hypothetical protein
MNKLTVAPTIAGLATIFVSVSAHAAVELARDRAGDLFVLLGTK